MGLFKQGCGFDCNVDEIRGVKDNFLEMECFCN